MVRRCARGPRSVGRGTQPFHRGRAHAARTSVAVWPHGREDPSLPLATACPAHGPARPLAAAGALTRCHSHRLTRVRLARPAAASRGKSRARQRRGRWGPGEEMRLSAMRPPAILHTGHQPFRCTPLTHRYIPLHTATHPYIPPHTATYRHTPPHTATHRYRPSPG